MESGSGPGMTDGEKEGTNQSKTMISCSFLICLEMAEGIKSHLATSNEVRTLLRC